MSNLVEYSDPDLDLLLMKRIWENDMPGFEHEEPNEGPTYQALSLVAGRMLGTIVSSEVESVLLYQGLFQRFQVRWENGVYKITSEIASTTTKDPDAAVVLMGGEPPYEYVGRDWANGKQYIRVFHN